MKQNTSSQDNYINKNLLKRSQRTDVSNIETSKQKTTMNGPSSSNSNSNGNVVGKNVNANSASDTTSPICRCRVTYLGSSVPHVTKDGLQGIQEPLKGLYPDTNIIASGDAGIDSWLSVWSNGVLIENIDENGQEVKRFFQIEALHYCAAVKFVSFLQNSPNHSAQKETSKFLPLDSPITRNSDSNHPPLFACILRRTTGIKVLECHAFICKREAAANALVRCCFHAYADTMYAKQIGADLNNNITASKPIHAPKELPPRNPPTQAIHPSIPTMPDRKSKSIAALNEPNGQINESWLKKLTGSRPKSSTRSKNNDSYSNSKPEYMQYGHINSNIDGFKTLQSQKASNVKAVNEQLVKNVKLSKSMHHLHQDFDQIYGQYPNLPFSDYPERFPTQLSAMSCADISNQAALLNQHQEPHLLTQMPPQMLHQPFYNPNIGKVPSMFQIPSRGGTLRSIKSLATNSIASTLLKSKKHAKSMSGNQTNPALFIQQPIPQQFRNDSLNAPVPAMFLPNFPHKIMSGSQTMKLPSKSMTQLLTPQPNFETLSIKDMKKIIKKSAKYGLTPAFGDGGLPIPPFQTPLPPPSMFGMSLPASKSGTMISQHHSILNAPAMDLPDFAKQPYGTLPPHNIDQMNGPRPILVKPNPEFLKSKAGKKWIKQQKEFKKLLPPHLEGLPIVFGPPPPEALEPAMVPTNIAPPFINPAQMPFTNISDNLSFINGRANMGYPMIRYSPGSQVIDDTYHHHQQQRLGTNCENRGFMDLDNHHHTRGKRYNSDESSMIFANSESSGDIYRKQKSPHHNLRPSHMVEQRVISLEDENELDEEVQESHIDCYGSITNINEDDLSKQSRQSSNSNFGNRNRVDEITLANINAGEHSTRVYEQLPMHPSDALNYNNGHTSNGHESNSAQIQQYMVISDKPSQGHYNVPYEHQQQSSQNQNGNGREYITHGGNGFPKTKQLFNGDIHHHTHNNNHHMGAMNDLSSCLENTKLGNGIRNK